LIILKRSLALCPSLVAGEHTNGGRATGLYVVLYEIECELSKNESYSGLVTVAISYLPIPKPLFTRGLLTGVLYVFSALSVVPKVADGGGRS
jgi:hypothetical protein